MDARKIEEIFSAARALAGDERDAFVADACGDDAELRDEVASLLRHHDASQGFFGAAIEPDDAPTVASPRAATDIPLGAIEGYEILREIHRGGQGVVYQAMQKSTRRRVAIKVLHAGAFAGPRDRLRFDREVQILGQLHHPNIVAIHDSGIADGYSYFVMDYISGDALDAVMTSGPRSIDETLRLFVKICEAVNAAHLRGVIHRDLKPSNIRIDSEGEPHVLDFGLAKFATSDVTDESRPRVMSVTGQFLGSLPWASPEQAEGSPDKIDIRTDVYSLGVVLFELLTGRFPYEVVGNIRDVLRNILEAEPDRPSTMRRQINDEVETIVLKCLSKDRDRRYQSAGELARDIRRYLAGEPIEAKRDSGMYVARKLFRRHKLATAVAAGYVAVISIAAVGLWSKGRATAVAQMREAEQRQIAEGERDRARRSFAHVRELAHTFVFDFHDTIQHLDGALPARQLLVETALIYLENLADEVGDDPELRRELAKAHDRVGDLRGGIRNPSLGDTGGALESYREALRLREAMHTAPGDDPSLDRELATSHLHVGDMLLKSGEVTRALASYERSLELRSEPRSRAIALLTMGDAFLEMGQLDQARDHYERSIVIRRERAKPSDQRSRRELAVGLTRLAGLHTELGEYEAAVAQYLNVLDIREHLAGLEPDSARFRRDLAVSHLFLGQAYVDVGQPVRATEHLETCRATFTQFARDNPESARAPSDLALIRLCLGHAAGARGEWDAARGWFEEAGELLHVLSDADPLDTYYQGQLADADAGLGAARFALGDADAALAHYGRAIERARTVADKDVNDAFAQGALAEYLVGLGAVLAHTGALDDARANLHAAHDLLKSLYIRKPRSADVRKTLTRALVELSEVARAQGDADAALDSARHAINVAGLEPELLQLAARAHFARRDRPAAIDATERALRRLEGRPATPERAALRQALTDDLATYREDANEDPDDR